jgi:N-acetylmuramoyl-L-alanine amidase
MFSPKQAEELDMSKYLFILDPGHGGIIAGLYQTSGKRSPIWSDDSQLFEGEFNRDVVKKICDIAPAFDIECVNLVPEETDVSLEERVRRSEDYRKKNQNKQCVYISVHANAGGGHGIEVYTSKGATRSDPMATAFLEKMNYIFQDTRIRTDPSDGDPDKEANFYVLKKTVMPAILTENFFMDNERECKEILMTYEGRMKIAMAHLAAMVEIEREGL